MRVPQRVERAGVRFLALRIERVAAVDRDVVRLAQRVPQLFQSDRRFGTAFLPQDIGHLGIQAGATTERLDASEDRADQVAETPRIGCALQYQFPDEGSRLHHVELAGALQRLRMEVAGAQPGEKLRGMVGTGDDDHAVAAPQTAFEESLY